MNKILCILIMALVSVSMFSNELEKIDNSKKGVLIYKGKKLYSNRSITNIYKEAGADKAMAQFNKGMTKIYLSILPSLGAGASMGVAYLQYRDSNEVNVGLTLTAIGLFSGALYLGHLGTQEKLESVNIYNEMVNNTNKVSFNLAPVVAPKKLGVMLVANF